MSFSTTIDRVTLSGNGATTGFSFPYILFATADLKVYLKNNTTGAETLQTITTHYTISGTLTNGVYESGVTVTFLTAPTASQTVLMLRDRDVTQELDLDENGKIPSTSLEKQLDKFATYIQRVKNKLARTIGLPEGYTASFDPTLPPVMVNDGYLKTTSTGAGLEYVAQADLINTISTGVQAFTASRAIVSYTNGLATSATTTATEIGYVNGVTSQLSGNSQSATLTNKTIDADLNTITNIKNADIKSGANIAMNKLVALSSNRAVITDGSGNFTGSATTATELSYVGGATSSIQTQLNTKAPLASPTFTGTVAITANALDLQIGQIAFPSTQNASAGANTLDDYEEGTFTPTIRGTGTAGSGTYTTQVGRYTKIGNRVYFNLYLAWTNLTGQSGTLAVGSLPFTANSTTNSFSAVSLADATNLTWTAAYLLTGYVNPNTDTIIFSQSSGGIASSGVTVDTSGGVMLAGHYEV